MSLSAWPIELALLASRRWGGVAERVGLRVPPVQPGGVWVHGASLGEARIARRLAQALPEGFATADTTAGARITGALRPLDHPWALAPLWAEARPRLLVFVEGSWWPGLVTLARRAGVPVAQVAARPSRTTALRGAVLGWPDAVFARDAHAASWFRARGVAVHAVCGSLKHAPPGPNPLHWPTGFLVGASLRDGDLTALLAAREVAAPELPLLIAPRRLDRLGAVAAQLPRRWVARSALAGPVPPGTDVLLDTHGELASMFTGARAAFVGGTFDAAVGGHSPAEALVAGVPVAHGPEVASNALDFARPGCVRAESRVDLGRALRLALDARVEPPEDGLPALARALQELAGPPARESAPRPWARPLVPIQRAGLAARRLRSRRSFGVPVVAVGSHGARGSGKTSTALWVADQLAARGHRVGVATRGTGRTERSLGDSVRHGPDARWIGDEGALFALRGHRVCAHRDRARAAEALEGCTAIVLEDGLQCSGVRSDLRIATLDARYPLARGPFPTGEAREPRARADLWVAHHVDARFPAPPGALAAWRAPGPWSRAVAGPRVAFAGIARPADFFAGIPDLRATRAFPDHHRYTPDELAALLRWAGDATLLTTDRDAARLPAALRARVCWRGVSLEIPGFPVDRLP